MRLRVVLFVLSALLVSACNGGSSSDDSGRGSAAERRDVIQRVALSPEYGNPSGTPPPEGDYACTIYGGGPPGIQIPGTCRWDGERDGDAWIVSDTQTWRCADFSGIGGAGGPCTGEFGSHAWRHRVDGNGEITYLGSEGQFPPSLAE